MHGVGYLSPDSRGLPVTRWAALARRAGMLAVTLAMLTNTGCQSTHTVAMRADGAPQYEQVKVVYEVSQPRLDQEIKSDVQLAYAKSHPLKAALASRRKSLAASLPDRPVSRLTIEYPHPDGNTELARAILEDPVDEGTYRQVATTDFERHELDLLLVNLANGGAFDAEQRPTGDTQVAIEIDGVSMKRRWTKEPRLDRLASETLASYGGNTKTLAVSQSMPPR